MKKTLIALAVAASAAVSGSAMAWTANGTGGSVNLGGTLTPVEKVTPWEVKVGDAVTGLDAQIQKGQKVVNISVDKTIPILGIRSIKNVFKGVSGVSPQIDYHGAVDAAKFTGGYVPLTLDVKDNHDAKIGTLTSTLGASADLSVNEGASSNHYFYVQARNPGDVFYGGLGTIMPEQNIAAKVFPGIGEHYDNQDGTYLAPTNATIKPDILYSGYYGSGIPQGHTIKITLDNPAGADQIAWKATLPVTVSYQ